MKAIAFGMMASATIIGDSIMHANKVPMENYGGFYVFILLCSFIGIVTSGIR